MSAAKEKTGAIWFGGCDFTNNYHILLNCMTVFSTYYYIFRVGQKVLLIGRCYANLQTLNWNKKLSGYFELYYS